MEKNAAQRTKKRSKLRIVLVIVGVLVIIRLILPSVILHYANKTLASMDGYYGRINDIDLSIYRGAYQIDDIYIDKLEEGTQKHIKFFNSKRIDLSVEWKALFHGSVVGELEFDMPALIFTKDKAELQEVQKDTNDFRKILDDFMPLRVNRFEINHGSIHYIDSTATPKVDVKLDDTYILAQNLTNATDNKLELPSTVVAHANAYEGRFEMDMRINPLAENPTFDLNAEMQNTNLVLLNDFLRAYGNFDVNRGEFGLYTEMAANEGRFKGYVKPVITNLDVVGKEDRPDNFFQKAWESIVGATGVVFKNQNKDQIATKVPMEGRFSNPDTDNWEAVWVVLKNAFIQALVPSIDYQISLKSVKEKPAEKKSFLDKLFSESKSKGSSGNKESKNNK